MYLINNLLKDKDFFPQISSENKDKIVDRDEN
jgi:hypothetical protein